jgi:predicted DNA-binding transcriptional regulator AlpA
MPNTPARESFPPVLDTEQVCDLLQIHPRTLANWRSTDSTFPEPCRLGTGKRRSNRWLLADLLGWMAGKKEAAHAC